MELPIRGQRWVSDSEPELGLGVVTGCVQGKVKLHFPAADESRQYALTSAPIRRVIFAAGDKIRLRSGIEITVRSVEATDGLVQYHCGNHSITEEELSDTISFSKPEDRLLAGVVDDLETFNLRLEANFRRTQMHQSPVRGYVGGRVDLISHQLFIASEVSERLRPRVLLADEVGLGKTIEAGLIMHRLHVTGRAQRILVLVPEPLVHQWFVEMLRKFNLLFSLFDEERCEQIQLHHEHLNPFLENQLILCSINFLTNDPVRSEQALQAGWDLLVVDEAHHLEWWVTESSPQYALVESLAKTTPGVLLLTATPQQLGPEGNFARLRLLDPDRYQDMGQFQEDATRYEQVAKAVEHVLSGQPLTKKELSLFAAKSPHVLELSQAMTSGDPVARTQLVGALLDEFGIGRVMFRNTRLALSGFPARKAHLVELAEETEARWLANLLRSLGNEKVLLICQTREKAEAMQSALLAEISVNTAVFHEGLTLLQRDRQAAYFAEEDGARILLCSEIGSEGRNFQFAHHLVLMDLPLNPELLEQRIGRLDRIGQKETIHIHVPFAKNSLYAALAQWYHDGLNSFEQHINGAAEIARLVESFLSAVVENPGDMNLRNALLKETLSVRQKVTKVLAQGHDRLLELSSCRLDQAATVAQRIRKLDDDLHFEKFMIRVLDHFGMTIEERGPRTYVLLPGNLQTDALPSMPAEGMTVTFDRLQAISREDWSFLTTDHPLVRGALDLLLGSEQGNASIAIWPDCGNDMILLECCFVAECIAPPALHTDRFMPATPIRIVVNHAMEDFSADRALISARLKSAEIANILTQGPLKTDILPAMLEGARTLATKKAAALARQAAKKMTTQLESEWSRLHTLSLRNDHIRREELDSLKSHQADLESAIQGARVRLDAVRLILCKRNG